MCVMYVVCGIVLSFQDKPELAVFYSLYGLSFFFCNMGPNTTTFVIPSELFPTSIRASAHGVSAAAGKVGAAIGTALMPAILEVSTLPTVMFISAAVAASGFVFSVFLTRESQHTDIMQSAQHEHTSVEERDGGSSSNDGGTPPSSHTSSARNSLPSLSLSRAIRKARGYTDLLKQQSTIDEEEDEPAHNVDDMELDEHDDEMDEEHRMDSDDSDESEQRERQRQQQQQRAELEAAPTVGRDRRRTPTERTADNRQATSKQSPEVELASTV